jgi:hypothetical protein
MNVEIGTEAAQFPEKEYINGIFVAVQNTFYTIHALTNARSKVIAQLTRRKAPPVRFPASLYSRYIYSPSSSSLMSLAA